MSSSQPEAVRKSDSEERQSDASEIQQSEEENESHSERQVSPGSVRADTDRRSTAADYLSVHDLSLQRSQEQYVKYHAGPEHDTLARSYGVDFVRKGQAAKLQRLGQEFGSNQVQRWAEEGMTFEKMGKSHDERAFRNRQQNRSGEIPTDIERRNIASLHRNATSSRENGRAGATGVPDVVRNVVSSQGTAMNEPVQREMESKMGRDFSDVQLHTGPRPPPQPSRSTPARLPSGTTWRSTAGSTGRNRQTGRRFWPTS